MTSTLERRVAALEDSAGESGKCPECGGPDEPDDHTTYEVVWVDEAEEEWCEKCGRELITTIYFDDDPRAPWNATVDTVDP